MSPQEVQAPQKPQADQSTQTPENPESKSTPEQQVPSQPSTSLAPPASNPCPDPSQSTPTSNADCKSVGAKKSKRKKHSHTRQPVAPPNEGTAKTVVRNGSTADPTVGISPGGNEQQASWQLQGANQLLAKTEANLKAIADRQLSQTQQDTVKQIKTYMEQARLAVNSGDTQRAYNLANKANMLCADLMKR